MSDYDLRERVFDLCDDLKAQNDYMRGLGCERILNYHEKQGIPWEKIHALVKEWSASKLKPLNRLKEFFFPE